MIASLRYLLLRRLADTEVKKATADKARLHDLFKKKNKFTSDTWQQNIKNHRHE